MRTIAILLGLLLVLSLAGYAAAASGPEKFELGKTSPSVVSQEEMGRGGLATVPYDRMSPEKFELTHRQALTKDTTTCYVETGRGGLKLEHGNPIEKWQF